MAGDAFPSIQVVKTFTYRGGLREFSNRYHFTGGVPADSAHWTTLSDAITAAEKLIYGSTTGVTIVRTVGYDAGSDVPVFSKVYALAGTATLTNIGFTPGDVAALVRYSTAAKTGKNHPIYLFNYYHGACFQTGGSADIPNTDQKNLMSTYATAWITGFSDGTSAKHRCSPGGALATGSLVSPYLHHRDFPA